MKGVSVVIPALNEERTIGSVMDVVKKSLEQTGWAYEIVVVDDGSTDKTGDVARNAQARVIRHPVPGGYGLSLRDGIVNAKYGHVAIIDGDGTYPADRLVELIRYLEEYDMVVGARTGKVFQHSFSKYLTRKIFQILCEFVAGVKIPDVNSGFRAFKKDVVLRFRDNFCLGFSFTTTITLILHLNGYFVKYFPIDYYKRTGQSHVRIVRDSLRAAQIVTQAILYYNPIKLFLLLFLMLFLASIGLFWLFAVTGSMIVLALGQSFLIAAFIYFGMGLLADMKRERRL